MQASAPLLLGLAGWCAQASFSPDAAHQVASEATISTRVESDAKGFRLVRGEEPFFIQGAGGTEYLDQLRTAGGNSIRTWGVGRGTRALLDAAHRQGLTVTLGIWLERVGTGFDYGSEEALARQTDQVRAAVERYRDHPALLMWSLGNEGEADGQDTRYYEQVENLAQLVHELDPHHPTMTVLSELGKDGQKIKDLERLAPSLDVVGINSYGGVASVPQRYRQAGGTRPYVVTEFGPRGHWESPRTSWGTPIEMSSTEKARSYRACYEAAVLDQPLCLGADVFLWGQKQETTATWFGMFLDDGTRLGPVDAMTELWTGSPPENRVPEIKTLRIDADSVAPGRTIRASVEAKDADRDRLEIQWVLRSASPGDGRWGMREKTLQEFPDAILSSKGRVAKIRMPEAPGPYRLFAYVRDGEGGGAVHNVPLRVVE